MKNQNKKILIPTIIIILIIIGLIYFSNTEKDVVSAHVSQEDSETENSPKADEFSFESIPEENVFEYSEALDFSKFEGKKIIINFSAVWCPSCQILKRSISENVNVIPNDLVIITADYDKEKDLREKYEVFHQHTLVQVDQNGEKINILRNVFSIEDLIDSLK